jgi:uncharacterized protein
MGPGMGPGMGTGPGMGMGGGSFLGTAAASAAGVIGGAMLLNGIRSMFSHPSGGASAFDQTAASSSPWSAGSAADSSLARDAGIDHIGSERTAAHDTSRDDDGGRSGLFGGGDQDDDNVIDDDDTDFAGDFDGGDTDSA